ncbi:toll/interleukin-1 receptor domain-containing protein [candidate division KSB1 bacterium]|nr:toll/interleukin-1 receptor domain-containing protein [candidate division KSB1 bacterium]
MTYKIFISAAQKDADLVMDLTRRLKKAGYKVLSKEFQPDEAIDRRIRQSLSESDEVLILVTDKSLNNPWVTPILGAAFGLHKPITAILVGVHEHEFPLMVQGMRHLKYAEVDDYISELQSRSVKVAV